MFALGIGEFRVMRTQKRKRSEIESVRLDTFALLPERRYDFLTNWTLKSLSRSSVESYKQLLSIFSPTSCQTKFNGWTKEKKDALFAAYHETLELRWLFRRFLQKFRLRKCKIVNDVDPFTLEAVQDPIMVHTLGCGSVHAFNAKGLAKQITTNLMEHDGFFHEPRFPINPFTNIPFTLFDLHTILMKLRKKGYSNWILESVRSCQYDLDVWSKKFESPVRTNSIDTIMNDLSSSLCIEYLIEFVELQYELTDRHFNSYFFKWIFTNPACIDYTKMWQHEARKYYIAKYTSIDVKEHLNLDIRTVLTCSGILSVPDYIKDLYSKRLRFVQNNKIMTVITLLEEA